MQMFGETDAGRRPFVFSSPARCGSTGNRKLCPGSLSMWTQVLMGAQSAAWRRGVGLGARR
eukprot:4733007-Pyramimonas_sp.AAC.1